MRRCGPGGPPRGVAEWSRRMFTYPDAVSSEIRISVRDLCEFILREGDLHSDEMLFDKQALNRGTKIHRSLQKKAKAANSGFHAEVRVSGNAVCGGFRFVVQGVVDGIYEDEAGLLLEEIKTLDVPSSELQWGYCHAYDAQLFCYGYLVMKDKGLASIRLRLLYFNYRTEEQTPLEVTQTFADSEQFFYSLLEEYTKFAFCLSKHRKRRNASLQSMSFPHPAYRKGQRELAGYVYRSIRDETRLFAEAPTGIGKTISTLFPALKALGEGSGSKLFYLTAKNSTSVEAYKTLLHLFHDGAALKVILLTAKDKICLCNRGRDGERGHDCRPKHCPYAKGHLNRINAALYDLISHESMIDESVLSAYADRHTVCPFDLGLDAAVMCDVVIGDYNYAFDPQAGLKRFFAEKGDFVLLIDEAHNMVERAREMYSAKIDKRALSAASKHLKQAPAPLRRAHRKLLSAITELDDREDKQPPFFRTREKMDDAFLKAVSLFCTQYEMFLSQRGFDSVKEETQELYFDCYFFLTIAELCRSHPDSYVLYEEYSGTGIAVKGKKSRRGENVAIKNFCVNPAELVCMVCERVRSSIFFSATLAPFDYYAQMLGADFSDGTDKYAVIPSPFPAERFKVLIADQLSTRLQDRAKNLEAITEMIYAALQVRKGNYFVFFPSFQYMNDVYAIFHSRHPETDTLIQSSDMTKQERDAYLERFHQYGDRVFAAFAVSGGVFSEGIDLPGERLSGAVIVGTGLPSVSFERALMKEHFDHTMGKGRGYDYAYTYPGLNRVFQAAGRVIRTETDAGFVLLIDDRFTKPSHLTHFPRHWRPEVVGDRNEIETKISLFWKRAKF